MVMLESDWLPQQPYHHFQLCLPIKAVDMQLNNGMILKAMGVYHEVLEDARKEFDRLQAKKPTSRNPRTTPEDPQNDVTSIVNDLMKNKAAWIQDPSHPIYKLLDFSHKFTQQGDKATNKEKLYYHANMQHLLMSIVGQGLGSDGGGSDLEDKLPIINVIGNQSAGKTTICTALTGQVVFYISNGTATKVRTMISNLFDPDLRSVTCSLRFDNQHRDGLTPTELLTLYCELFGSNSSAKVDDRKIASVQIASARPSINVTVLDHPGFNPNIDINERAHSACRKSFEKYMKKGKGILLIAHKLADEVSVNGWGNLNGISDIDSSRVFVAITICDELNHNNISKSILDSKRYRQQPGKDIKMTALEILNHIQNEFLSYRSSENNQLPRKTQFFFVASCSERMDSLVNSYKTPEDRYHAFLTNPVYGQDAMMKIFLDKLKNKAEWLKYGIELVDMNPAEEKQLAARVGIPNLLKALIQKQSEELIEVATAAAKLVQPPAENAQRRLQLAIESLEQRSSVADVVLQFVEIFIQFFHTITAEQLYYGSAESKSGILDALRNSMETLKNDLGFTLEEVDEIFDRISNGVVDFPPTEYRTSDFDKLKRDWRQPLVRPADKKLYKLTYLLQREQANWAFFSSLITHPKEDYQNIIKELTMSQSITVSSIVGATISTVKSHFRKILGDSSSGGNELAARRAALSVALAADCGLSVMTDIPHFAAVLRDPTSTRQLQLAQKRVEDAENLLKKAEKAVADNAGASAGPDPSLELAVDGATKQLEAAKKELDEKKKNFKSEQINIRSNISDISRLLDVNRVKVGSCQYHLDLLDTYLSSAFNIIRERNLISDRLARSLRALSFSRKL